MIIHSVSKIHCVVVDVVLPLQQLHDKKYKTLTIAIDTTCYFPVIPI